MSFLNNIKMLPKSQMSAVLGSEVMGGPTGLVFGGGDHRSDATSSGIPEGPIEMVVQGKDTPAQSSRETGLGKISLGTSGIVINFTLLLLFIFILVVFILSRRGRRG